MQLRHAVATRGGAAFIKGTVFVVPSTAHRCAVAKHCQNAAVHVKACRPGRPLCRWRRRLRWGTCSCAAYHFPHRGGSGACGNPASLWAELDKPRRKH